MRVWEVWAVILLLRATVASDVHNHTTEEEEADVTLSLPRGAADWMDTVLARSSQAIQELELIDVHCLTDNILSIVAENQVLKLQVESLKDALNRVSVEERKSFVDQYDTMTSELPKAADDGQFRILSEYFVLVLILVVVWILSFLCDFEEERNAFNQLPIY